MKHQKLTLSLLFCILCMCFTFSVSAATTKYTVKFVDIFDGKEKVISTQSVEKNQEATEPTRIPTHKGYEFSKWSTKFNKITKNTTVKAIYKQTDTIVYFVDATESTKNVFYLNGKKVTFKGRLLNKTPKYYEEGAEVEVSDFPKLTDKTGYTANGWTGIKAGQTFKKPKIIVAKAKYVPISYTIEYVGGDEATGSMKKKVVSYGKTVTLAKNKFKRNGCKFKYWIGSDGKSYKDGEKVKNLTATNKGVFKMTASWESTVYEITYKSGANEVIEEHAPYTYHNVNYVVYSIAHQSAKTGEIIYVENVSETKRMRDVDTPNIIYKGAQTEANRYKRIDKKTKKGVIDELVMPQNPTVCKISDVFILNNPTRTFYEFKGWKDSKTGKVKKEVCVSNLTSNKTFTAVWTKKKYVVKFEDTDKTTTKKYTVSDAFKDIPLGKRKKPDHSIDFWMVKNNRNEIYKNDEKVGMILKYMEKNQLSEITLVPAPYLGPPISVKVE